MRGEGSTAQYKNECSLLVVPVVPYSELATALAKLQFSVNPYTPLVFVVNWLAN